MLPIHSSIFLPTVYIDALLVKVLLILRLEILQTQNNLKNELNLCLHLPSALVRERGREGNMDLRP